MTFLSLYNSQAVDSYERGMLAASFLSVAVLILRTCASASGVPTDKILGSVAASLETATAACRLPTILYWRAPFGRCPPPWPAVVSS